MLTLSTLLVAVDFSDTSTDAVRYAQELARSFNATLHLLHVVPDPLQQPWAVEAPGLDFPGLADQWRADAHERLSALGAGAGIGPDRRVLAVGIGAPHRIIVEYATDHLVDLIVLGTHGHGQVVHFLLGSVAERVLRQSSCPVLVVPHRSIRARPASRASRGSPTPGA